MKIAPLLLMMLLLWTGAAPAQTPPPQAPVLGLTLLNSRPHQAESYTQGLFFFGGKLYESSGLYGRSAVSVMDFSRGGTEPQKIARFTPEYFAEGACEAGGDIYVVTWREQRGFILAAGDLSLKGTFSYSGEGWGLAFDGRRLWRSDGSSRLQPHRPGDFAPDGPALTVRDGEREISQLNELEWDPTTGLMLANVYGSDRVAAIDLADGRVRFWLEAVPLRELVSRDGLVATENPWDVVLNGLALDGSSLWLTGKLWPRLYQISWPPEGWENLR